MDEREYVISFTLTTELEKDLVEAMVEQMLDDSLFNYAELSPATVEEVCERFSRGSQSRPS